MILEARMKEASRLPQEETLAIILALHHLCIYLLSQRAMDLQHDDLADFQRFIR